MPDGGNFTVETANVALDGAFAEAHPWARAGSFVRITVSETPGRAWRRRCWSAFSSRSYSAKSLEQGSGLGLSMVYGAIQQHSGLIDVSSEPGAGTAFNLYLPTAESKPAPEEKQPAAPGFPPGNSRGTVLIAEDEKQLQMLTAQILESKGFETICAANGEEAVKLFESQRDQIKLV